MNNTRVSIDGNQSVGQSRKVDVIGSDLSKQTTLLSIDGNQSVGQSRKVD
jgi:flagellar biogenesis protein FliO